MPKLRLYFCLAAGLLLAAYFAFLGLTQPGGWPGTALAASGPLLLFGGLLGMPPLYWREVRDVLEALDGPFRWLLAVGTVLIVVSNYLCVQAWLPRTLACLLVVYASMLLVIVWLALIGYRVETAAKK